MFVQIQFAPIECELTTRRPVDVCLFDVKNSKAIPVTGRGEL
jgi:hypothetical protein